MNTTTPARLGIMLGADGLLGSRSGIGRMTLELAHAMQSHSEIADFGLLIQRKIYPRTWLATLGGPFAATTAPTTEPASCVVRWPKHILKRYVPGASSLNQVRRSLEMRHELRQFRARLREATPLPLVYHEPNMILLPYDGPCVATINDLSWHYHPGLHPPERIRWIERYLPRTLTRANRFIAISAFTRDEAVRVFGLPADSVDVVHLAPASGFRPMSAVEATPALRQFGLRDQGYLLSISTLEPRKNFDRLLTAYLKLPDRLRQRMPLVIAGGKGWGTVLKTPDATRAAAAGQMRLLGHLPDGVLVALTARCAAFAYVSLYEGFGLPVIEAMATGVPVLASSTTATRETAGNAAVLVDPMDVDAIRDGLRLLLESPERRWTWAEASLQRAAEFSWQRTLDGMTKTWRQVAS